MATRKTRLTRESEKFIVDNMANFSSDEIAKKLNCTVKAVENVIEVYGNLPEQNVAWKQYLRKSIVWKQLKDQFSEDELQYFEESFVALMGQFNEDVWKTEESQIFQLITLDILMKRNLKAKRATRNHIEELEHLQRDMVARYNGDYTAMTDGDRSFIIDLEKQISGSRSAESNNSREFVEFQKQYNDILQQLKGTREQRIKQIESSKTSFVSMVKTLLEKDVQEKESRQMELFKLASQKELKRLGQPHQYVNQEIDLPILTSETLEEFDKENQKETNV